MGGRAERNEYLLLHAFHRDGYICPDKPSKKRTIHEQRDDDDHEQQGQEVAAGKRKAQYAGGLVLEPKKGEREAVESRKWEAFKNTLIAFEFSCLNGLNCLLIVCLILIKQR